MILIIIISVAALMLVAGVLILKYFKVSSDFEGMEFVVGYASIIFILNLYSNSIFDFSLKSLSVLYLIFFSILLANAVAKKMLKFSWSDLVKFFGALLPLMVFAVIGAAYGDNFIKFRGNIWDWFNYNTMAVAYSRYGSSEFGTLIADGNSLSSIAKLNITQRPAVVSLPAAILTFFRVDSFNLMYLYKGLILSVYFSSIFSLTRFLKYSKVKSYLISISIVFSMWTFYIVEIDALAQLSFLPFIPVYIFYMRAYTAIKSNTTHCLFSFIFGVSFILYPEFGSIALFITFLVILVDVIAKWRDGKKCIYINFISISIPILFVISINLEQSVIFLFRQLFLGFTAAVDWWGYFGGFLLGPNSPVTDPKTVLEIRDLVKSGGNNFYLNSNFISTVLPFAAYVLPSLFGFFHIVVFKSLLIPINLLCILTACLIAKWVFKKNIGYEGLWLKLILILLIALVLILVFRGNYWSAVKGLSFIFMLIPFVLLYVYSSSKFILPRLIIILLMLMAPLFPVYKYSEFNHGIGVYDGFPSVLHKSDKMSLDWSFDHKAFKTCKNILVNIENPFKRHFIIVNLENYGLSYAVSHEIRESYGFGAVIKGPMKESSLTFPLECVISK